MKSDFTGWRLRHELYEREAADLFRVDRRTWQNWAAGKGISGPVELLLWILQTYPQVEADLLHKLRRGEKL